ncbi:polysaccharide deacetylase [Streptomyces sp. NPDC047002]|uniref:polysaccharide deacetylase family protein n=1 Tax=Streptomyces sp. NPDC047002 TaxID=3155475 RepID=UPI003453C013
MADEPSRTPQAPETAGEPWQWDEPTWRGHVERVRAGRSLVPASWPGGARVAVALSFDSDHETPSLRDGEVRPGKLAQGEYGSRVAVPKILRLLDRHQAPTTFFMPAVSALLHPGEARSYTEGGHEVAIHGWIHERNMQLPPAAERELQLRSADTLERVSGQRPVGIRTPSWDFSDHTLAITREMGLLYDSSLMADDDPYELLADGEATGVVEIPVEWIRDDAPYFNMDRYTGLRPYTPPRSVLGIWRDEFDQAYREGGVFQLTMHPHFIGHRSRLPVLAELLDHISAHPGVWFTTHADLARHVAAQAGLPAGTTPSAPRTAAHEGP